MSWINQDWEHEAMKDQIYRLEAKIQMEREWQQWEEEQLKQKPAKIIHPIIKRKTDEAIDYTREIPGAHQKGT
jgi:hypothetical protein